MVLKMKNAFMAFFIVDVSAMVSAAFESIGTDRVPIFDRPVSGRETLSQLVFVLALHFVQHLDGSPPGHGQPVQTHSCSLLQPQRWPTSAHVMSTPRSDDLPGSPASSRTDTEPMLSAVFWASCCVGRYHTWISRTCLSLYESNGRDGVG